VVPCEQVVTEYTRWRNCCWLVFLIAQGIRAQDTPSPTLIPDPAVPTTATLAPPSVSEKWNFFLAETLTPLTLIAAGTDATVSQETRSAPLYGKHFWRHDAFLERFGATVGDDVSQNLFADFLLASALHEDTRYIRKGPSHRMWPRIGYAISRAAIARTDSGDATFNWANVTGCAMSARCRMRTIRN